MGFISVRRARAVDPLDSKTVGHSCDPTVKVAC